MTFKEALIESLAEMAKVVAITMVATTTAYYVHRFLEKSSK